MHYNTLFACVLVVLAVSSVSLAHEEEEGDNDVPTNSDVIVLTDATFQQALQDNDILLVEFYAPWCGHCKAFAPEYERLATMMKGKVAVAKVDCIDNGFVAQQQLIEAFPTIKLFRKGTGIEYTGGRSAEGLVEFLDRASRPALTTLKTKEEVDNFVAGKEAAFVGFFPDTEGHFFETFREYVHQESLKTATVFGVATGELYKEFGLELTPSFMLFRSALEPARIVYPPEKISGLTELNYKDLQSWLDVETLPEFDEISPGNYARYIGLGIPIGWVVIIPEKLEEAKQALASVAKEYKHKIAYVWLDHMKFGRQTSALALSGKVFPGFVITSGPDRFTMDETLPFTSEIITKFSSDFLSGKIEPTIKSEPIPEVPVSDENPVYKLVGKTFLPIIKDETKDVLVKFYAEWCGHCQALRPIYIELANKLKGVNSVLIAEINVPENDIPPYIPVSGFPTLMMFPVAHKMDPVDYEGDRSLDDMLNFVIKHSQPFTLPEEKEAPKEEL